MFGINSRVFMQLGIENNCFGIKAPEVLGQPNYSKNSGGRVLLLLMNNRALVIGQELLVSL